MEREIREGWGREGKRKCRIFSRVAESEEKKERERKDRCWLLILVVVVVLGGLMRKEGRKGI